MNNSFFDKIIFQYRYITDQYITEQAQLINKLLSRFNRQTSYLEIGVDQGRTFRKINCGNRDGIDPYGSYDVKYRMTSEMFFALNKIFFHKTYDVIFIDAAHLSLIVNIEIEECFKILNPGGYIVLHDTDPLIKKSAELIEGNIVSYLRGISYPHNQSHTDSLAGMAYNGDVWRSVAQIRMNQPNIQVFTVNCFCCSVLKKGKQKNMMKKVPFEKLDWEFFEKHRKQILNPIDFSKIETILKPNTSR